MLVKHVKEEEAPIKVLDVIVDECKLSEVGVKENKKFNSVSAKMAVNVINDFPLAYVKIDDQLRLDSDSFISTSIYKVKYIN